MSILYYVRDWIRDLGRGMAGVALACGVLFGVVGQAHAQSGDPFFPPAGAGLYIGATYGLGIFDSGVADSDTVDLREQSGSTLDEEDSAVSIFFGYAFDDSLGVEFFYTDLGELTAAGNISFDQFPRGRDFVACPSDPPDRDCTLTVGVKSIGVAVKGSFRLADDLLAFIKGGYHLYEAKYTAGNRTSTHTQSIDDSSPIFGVGFEYELNDQAAFMLGYDAYLSDLRYFYGGVRFNLQPRY